MLPLRIPAHVGRPAEDVFLRRQIRTRRSKLHPDHRRWPVPQHHQHLSVGAELGDHVGALVDGPDVVVLIDAHRMREFEAVIAAADFLEKVAALVEFEQPRVGAAVIHEDVALGVGRHRDRFAQVLARRQFQKVRHRREWNLRHILDGRLTLRKQSRGRQHQQSH